MRKKLKWALLFTGIGIIIFAVSLFPRYDAGLYNLAGSVLCVSRGLGSGYSGCCVFNVPEITMLTLSN